MLPPNLLNMNSVPQATPAAQQPGAAADAEQQPDLSQQVAPQLRNNITSLFSQNKPPVFGVVFK